jgi:Zn-dependent metalloprotease
MPASKLTMRCGCCFIVPPVVLKDLSRGKLVKPQAPKEFQDSYLETQRLRSIREGFRVATVTTRTSLFAAPSDVVPGERLFDCQHRQSLPGVSVANASADPFKTVKDTTSKVAEFYKTVLGRNSIDKHGMDLVSSLNYGVNYQNAFWNGQQMVYGNGDMRIFVDFWRSPDVIGHELTHGVTQYESGLRYEGESGALNESISDCFGVVFNQWLNKYTADQAQGWLVGAGIMGPAAKAKGYTCLRDMINPKAKHCLSPQPDSYDQFDPAGDVHENSGIPNKAFALFAQALGGNAWDTAIKIWYGACTGGHLSSSAAINDFARATVNAANHWTGTDKPAVVKAIAAAWKKVKVPVAVA